MNATNEPTIFRTPHNRDNPYFMMTRAAAQDRTLSFEARGMLGYLLSKPSNWRVSIEDLKQQCGRDKVYTILKELIDARYIQRMTKQRPGWRSGTTVEYQVYETPFHFPDFQDTENQDTDNPLLHNRDKKQNKEREREQTPPSAPQHLAAMQRAMSPDLGAYLDAWREGHGDHKPIALRGRSRTEALEDAEELVKMGATPQDVQDYTAQRKASNKSTAWKFIIQDFHIFMAQKATQAVQEEKKTQAASTRFYDLATDTTNTWDMMNQKWIYEKGNTLT